MPKDESTERYRRLNDVMALLENAKIVTLDELLDRGNYSDIRTLRRDLRCLRNSYNAEIRYDCSYSKGSIKGVYILESSGNFVINLKITRQEVGALTSGLKMAGHFLPHLKDSARTLWKKIDKYIPRDISREGESLARMTTIAVPAAKVNPKIFDLILSAIRNHQSVIIGYKSPAKSPRKWTLSPYTFYFRGSSWYLVAFNHAFKNITIYRAGRIRSVKISDAPYVNAEESGFSEEYISSAWYVTPGQAMHKIVLYISPELSDSIRELELHPTQTLEPTEDGGMILTAEVPNLDEAARWVMAGAPGVRVIEPEELQEIVSEYCKTLLTRLNR